MFRPLATALAAAVWMTAASSAFAADKPPVRLAVIDPLSGPMASVGVAGIEAVKFEAARLNAEEGGINGHPLEIVSMDSKVNPQEALVQLQKAIDDGVRFISQANSSAVSAALLNAVDKHNKRNPDKRVLFFNFGGVDPALTNERCSFWHFRFDANADMKMKSLTDWVAKRSEFHKIFLLNQDYSFGHALSEAARKDLKEKRPDIEIVGDVFHPVAKVKDFTPYVTQIKSSGADGVITGNWGADATLLVKAAADYGLDIPFLTYYTNSLGTITQLGKQGVDRVYLVYIYSGDYDDPKMAARQEKMFKETGYDYGDMRAFYMLNMFRKAAVKADSIDPTKVAFALEGIEHDASVGTAVMRPDDHQILAPLLISVFKDNMKHGAEGTPFNFHEIDRFSAQQVAMPTSCKMERPAK